MTLLEGAEINQNPVNTERALTTHPVRRGILQPGSARGEHNTLFDRFACLKFPVAKRDYEGINRMMAWFVGSQVSPETAKGWRLGRFLLPDWAALRCANDAREMAAAWMELSHELDDYLATQGFAVSRAAQDAALPHARAVMRAKRAAKAAASAGASQDATPTP